MIVWFKSSKIKPMFLSKVFLLLNAGPHGQLSVPLFPFMKLEFPVPPEDSPKKYMKISVDNPKIKFQRSLWGTTNTLIQNAIEVPVKLVGVGYRAAIENGKLVCRLGYANPIHFDIPDDVKVQVPAPQRIILQGIDRHRVTLFAAQIRKHRPPEPYNQKGVFVADETIKKKDGKKK